jgi:hypothetical protein
MALVLCILLLVPLECAGLGINYEKSLEQQLRIIIAKHPRYVWGGSEDETKGLDCSGYIYLASRRAALPVSRTTSLSMSRGGGNFIGHDILFRDARGLDFIWWTFTANRPQGHIGVLIRHPATGVPAVTHSSSKRGVVCDYTTGALLRDISKVRRLSIGDN